MNKTKRISRTENMLKNINIKNFDKISETDFLSKFLTGHTYFSDFKYLKKEMPELLNSLSLDGDWYDYNNEYHSIEKHYYLFGKKEKRTNAILIYSELFFENNKIKFFRYSENASFYKKSFIINNNGKKYYGSIPYLSNKDDSFFESFSDEKKLFNISFSAYAYNKNSLSIDFSLNKGIQQENFITINYFDNNINWYFSKKYENDIEFSKISNFIKKYSYEITNDYDNINNYLIIFEKLIDFYNVNYL